MWWSISRRLNYCRPASIGASKYCVHSKLLLKHRSKRTTACSSTNRKKSRWTRRQNTTVTFSSPTNCFSGFWTSSQGTLCCTVHQLAPPPRGKFMRKYLSKFRSNTLSYCSKEQIFYWREIRVGIPRELPAARKEGDRMKYVNIIVHVLSYIYEVRSIYYHRLYFVYIIILSYNI